MKKRTHIWLAAAAAVIAVLAGTMIMKNNGGEKRIYCDAGIKRNIRFIIATVTGHSFDCYIIVILIITQDIEIIHGVGAEIQLVSGLVRDKLMIDIYSVNNHIGSIRIFVHKLWFETLFGHFVDTFRIIHGVQLVALVLQHIKGIGQGLGDSHRIGTGV